MREIKERLLETDVLVIGAGGAGLRAAIEAQNMGAKVLIVSKGDFPSGCITAIAMGGMLAAFDEQDSPDRHFEDTLRGGDYLNNPRLVRLLVDRAADRAKDIERYGTEFDKKDGKYKLFPFTGSSVPRGVVARERYRGGYFKGLVKEAERLGINILQHVMITDLTKGKDGVISGAIGLELDTDTVLIVKAKATILATGGAGNLYSLTTNLPGITGDGYALAYRAGAQLSDMEFMQSRACMIYPKGMRGTAPPADGLVTLGGRFYNGLCERYMRKYHANKLELVTRAEMARCAQKEILAGRNSPHGGVFGDLSGVTNEELSKFEGWLKRCATENFDPTWQPYEWAPGAHHFMGGVVINERCETNVTGLYAAGEVECGVHGTNRLAGNALTETQVFGAIAGKHAAQRALAASIKPIPPSQINLLKERITSILKRDKGFDPVEVRDEITEIMSRYVGVIKNDEGLRKAAYLLDQIEQNKLAKLYLTGERSFRSLAGLLEVENLTSVGQLVTKAARQRTETRGSHNREDYPKLDEAWSKHILLQLEKGLPTLKIKPLCELNGYPAFQERG